MNNLPNEVKLKIDEVKQVIVVNHSLKMRMGKIAAQVAHAAMKFLVAGTYDSMYDYEQKEYTNSKLVKFLTTEQTLWLTGAFAKIVCRVDSEEELQAIIASAQAANLTTHSIIDSGRTEFHGVPTLTCVAIGPHYASKIDPITSHLKLL